MEENTAQQYVITNGHGYLKVEKGKWPIHQFSLDTASIFQSAESAQEIVDGLRSPLKNNRYEVKPLDEAKELEGESETDTDLQVADNQLTKTFQYCVYDNPELTELKNRVKIAQCLFLSMNDEYDVWTERLRHVNDEIIDIEHAIEFKRVNAVKACAMYKKLQEARRERRNCKDALYLLGWTKNATAATWKSGKINNVLESMENRVYSPKALPELFEDD